MNENKSYPTGPRPAHDIGTIPIAGGAPEAADPPSAKAKPLAAKASGTDGKRSRPAAGPPPPAPSGKAGDGKGRRHRSSPPLSNRLLWPAVLGAGLFLVYLLLSQLLVSLFAPRLLAEHYSRKLERPVTIARADWRPLRLSITLHNGIVGPRLTDPDDRIDPLFSFRALEAKLRPGNLLTAHPLIPALHLEQPFLHVQRRAGGNYNIRPETLPQLPNLITINNGRLLFSDQHLARFQPSAANRELYLEVREINGRLKQPAGQASGAGRAINLAGIGPESAGVRLEGTMTPSTARATPLTRGEELRLVLNRWPLGDLAAALEPLLAVNIADGLLTMQTSLQPGPAGLWQISHNLQLENLRLGSTVGPPEQAAASRRLQALLTDQRRILDLELELEVQTRRRDHPYLQELAASLTDLSQRAQTAPFAFLPAEFREIPPKLGFPAGASSPGREAGRLLDQLAGVLAVRPLLQVELTGLADQECDRDKLLQQQRELVTEQRRQAVAELARQVAAGGQVTVTAAAIDRLRPENVQVGETELLALAAQRRQAASQRLLIAMGIDPQETDHRLLSAPAKLLSQPAATTPPDSGCLGLSWRWLP